jgi:hypothetical protein
VVYTRTVEDRELNFGVSGKLYKDALVMFDRETNSLWTQVDGSVLRGELEGRQLNKVPALQTTWKQWKKLHPDTLALKKAASDKREKESVYADYHANPGMMGINDAQNPDSRLPGKSLVVTVRDGNDALAVPVEKLEKKPLHQTEVAGAPLAVVFHRNSETARVFDRRVDGRTLSFQLGRRRGEIHLRDAETGTLWSGLTGKAVKGELAGKELKAVPHMVNYWFAWAAYNPRTRVEEP